MPTSSAAPVRRLTLALATLLALLGCAPVPALPGAAPSAPYPSATSPAPAGPVTLRVMAFNDFHGNLEPANLSLGLADPRQPGKTLRVATGGAAALGGLVATLRQSAAHSVLLSSGDMVGAAPLVSSLFRHESTVEVLNQIGVDAVTVGNHEFDAGVVELQRLLAGGCGDNPARAVAQSCALGAGYAGAKFRVITANVRGANGQPLFAPSWVQAYGPVKVGFIGAVTRSTPGIVVPSAVAGLRFDDEADAINRSARALLAQGVKALVLSIHEGGEIGLPGQPADWNDKACPGFRGAIVEIARRVTPAVALIVSGHSHQGYSCRVNGIPVLQAVSAGRGLSVAELVIDPISGEVDRSQTLARNLPVLNERTEPAQREALASAETPAYAAALRQTRPDAAVAATVAAYSAAAAPRAQRPVGRIVGSFDRRGPVDSSAGRLIADAQLAATQAPEAGGAQLALMNPGGIRSDLLCRSTPPCTVSFGEAFTMQPFGNTLTVMSLTGAELKSVLEQQQPAGRDAPHFLQPSAGLQYAWHARAAQGQRVRALSLNGRAVQADQLLRVTVNNFMAEGGDGFGALKAGRQRLGGVSDIDALTAHLQSQPAPETQPRIRWLD